MDHATPNLPARDLTATEAFYALLGFEQSYRSDHWMILERGGVTLEFFPFPDLDPGTSSFGCCLRLDDLGAFFQTCEQAGIPCRPTGWPRLHAPATDAPSGLTIGYLVDLDGTLLRLVQNPED